MKFQSTSIDGARLIQPEPAVDERGSFARVFCTEEFARAGIPTQFPQWSYSFNTRKNTLRGMHYQAAPRADGKLVRCTRGVIHDVILDLRKSSPTYLKWEAFELSAENHLTLYLPPGVAHGFQTLVDATEVLYQIDVPYVAELARGVRWDDPAFGIRWPLSQPILSERDRGWPNFTP